MKFGGDNFRLKVCFTWDNSQTTGQDPSGWKACVGGDVADPRVLTVWRKIFYFPDAMNATGHSDAINESYIRGGFDDGFVEMTPISAEQPPHAYWLWYHPTPSGPECDHDLFPNEISPTSLGVRTYAHTYVNRYLNPQGGTHPPVPRHSVQSLGSHIVAERRAQNDPEKLQGKVFGVACLPWPQDPVHTSVAVFTITNANDRIWMAPDKTLQEECDSTFLELDGNCASPDQMQERVPLHELGHAVGGWLQGTDSTGYCNWNALNTDRDNSVMVNRCQYHRDFESFFSFTQIRNLREGSIQIQ